MARTEKYYFIREIFRALDILEQFHDDIDELDVSQLSNRLNLSPKNVFNILKTLESRHYVECNETTNSYRLGLKAFSTSQAFKKRLGLLKQAKPALREIANVCHETTNVSILKKSHLVCLDSVETNQRIQIAPMAGLVFPAHCTAAGKIQLAYMADRELDNYLFNVDVKPYTARTITDREQLRTHLSITAGQGYAVDNEEFDIGVRCVSAPIRDYTKRVIGAISISGPCTRLTDHRLESELIPLAQKTGKKLSARLGYNDTGESELWQEKSRK